MNTSTKRFLTRLYLYNRIIVKIIILPIISAGYNSLHAKPLESYLDKQLNRNIFSNDAEIQTRLIRLDPFIIKFVSSVPKTSPSKTLMIPWLMIHGLGGSLKDFENLIKIAKRNHHILAIDLPGFGGSIGFENQYSFADYSDVIYRFLEAGHHKKVHLICHSLGAQTCIIFSLQNLYLVKSLTLIDAAGSYNKEQYIKSLLEHHANINIGKILNGEYSKISDLNWISNDFIKTMITDNPIFMLIIESFRYNIRKSVKRLKVPVHIIWGEEDPIFDVNSAFHLKENIYGSTLHILRKGGHSPHISNPDIVYQWISNFNHNMDRKPDA